jgi:hypothetical protein
LGEAPKLQAELQGSGGPLLCVAVPARGSGEKLGYLTYLLQGETFLQLQVLPSSLRERLVTQRLVAQHFQLARYELFSLPHETEQWSVFCSRRGLLHSAIYLGKSIT